MSEAPFTPEQIAVLRELIGSAKPKTKPKKRKPRGDRRDPPAAGASTRDLLVTGAAKREMTEMRERAPLTPLAVSTDRFGSPPAQEPEPVPAAADRFAAPPAGENGASKPGYEETHPLDVNASIMEEAMHAKRGNEKLRIVVDECRLVMQTLAAAEYDHQQKRYVTAAELRKMASDFLQAKGWSGRWVVVTSRAGSADLDASKNDHVPDYNRGAD